MGQGLDSIFLLVLLLALAVPFVALGLAIAALARVGELRRQQARLREEVERLRAGATADHGGPVATLTPGQPQPAQPQPAQPQPAQPQPAQPQPAQAQPGQVQPHPAHSGLAQPEPAHPARSQAAAPLAEPGAGPPAQPLATPLPEAMPFHAVRPQPLPPLAPPPPLPRPLDSLDPRFDPSGAPRPPHPLPSRGAVAETARGAGDGERTPPASRPTMSLEELVGTRVIVWIAAVALALGGVFLVRYFVQRGLLTDEAKVGLATLLGAALIASGEFLRRRGLAQVAQGLVAAAIPVLYAAVLASVQLYRLIDPGTGFVLLALVTALAVFLSLRHGSLVALLGLIGGFLMPSLIDAQSRAAVELFGYLLLLQVGLIAIARHRQWWWLIALALLGGLAWAAIWLLFRYDPSQRLWISQFLLATTAAFVAATWRLPEKGLHRQIATALSWAAFGGTLLLNGFLVAQRTSTWIDWAFLGALSVATLVVGCLRHDCLGLPWLAATLVGVILAATGVEQLGKISFSVLVTLFGCLFVAGSYLCLWQSHGAWWARLCGCAGVGYLLLARFELQAQPLVPWLALALIAAALYATMTVLVARNRDLLIGGAAALGALAVTSATLVALAMWWCVGDARAQRAWIGVAWALQMPVCAWIARRLDLREMYGMTAVLGGLLALRLLANPSVLAYPAGDTPIFNLYLWGYGVPIVGVGVAAWILRARPRAAQACEVLAVLLGYALVSLLVRHAFHPGELGRGGGSLREVAGYAGAWGAVGLSLGLASLRWGRPALGTFGLGGVIASVVIAAVGACLRYNPLVTGEGVGDLRVFNDLLLAYGLPAVVAFAGARLAHRLRETTRGPPLAVLGLAGLVFVFVLVTLEVRHAFVGAVLSAPNLGGPPPTQVEGYAYSAAWILLAVVLLVLGLFLRSPLRPALRWASLTVLLAAVAKVFLYDTRMLMDLWRVLSFIGLGASLILIAIVYQRFVFRRDPTEAGAETR